MDPGVSEMYVYGNTAYKWHNRRQWENEYELCIICDYDYYYYQYYVTKLTSLCCVSVNFYHTTFPFTYVAYEFNESVRILELPHYTAGLYAGPTYC